MRIIIAAYGREFVMEVGLQEPVQEIKRKIEQSLSIPVTSQTLAVAGCWELLDGLDMEDYPIVQEGTRIDLTVTNPMLPPQQAARIQITVKFSSRKFNIEVDATETVRSLKEKIHIVDGTPVKRMLLFFSGTELCDEFRNLSEYGIGGLSEIVVFLKSVSRVRDNPPIRRLGFWVQTSSNLLDGATIPVEMEDSGTVTELRQLLLSSKVLPQEDYIYIHKQRLMRDSCSLRWHGVQSGDILYVFKGTVTRGGS